MSNSVSLCKMESEFQQDCPFTSPRLWAVPIAFTLAPRHTEFSPGTLLHAEMNKRDFLVITVRSGRPPSGELTSHYSVP